jgi:hypothetical protein
MAMHRCIKHARGLHKLNYLYVCEPTLECCTKFTRLKNTKHPPLTRIEARGSRRWRPNCAPSVNASFSSKRNPSCGSFSRSRHTSGSVDSPCHSDNLSQTRRSHKVCKSLLHGPEIQQTNNPETQDSATCPRFQHPRQWIPLPRSHRRASLKRGSP